VSVLGTVNVINPEEINIFTPKIVNPVTKSTEESAAQELKGDPSETQ